jgi:hypothetical protein
VRYWPALLVLSGTLALSAPSLARDIHLHIKMSATALKQTCDSAGGRFSQGPKRAGCGTDCHGGPGTDCIVTCVPGHRCIAQVIGARRPRTVLQALHAPGKYPR